MMFENLGGDGDGDGDGDSDGDGDGDGDEKFWFTTGFFLTKNSKKNIF